MSPNVRNSKRDDGLLKSMKWPDWNEPFKIMCDANDFVIGPILGQHHEKIFRAMLRIVQQW